MMMAVSHTDGGAYNSAMHAGTMLMFIPATELEQTLL